MIAVKVTSSRSWLDREFGKVAAAKLAARLVDRVRGEVGVFLTLTYQREAWESPLELYRAAAEERHVRLFMRRLSAELGQSLSGRWLCKLEFQRGGWVHWHLVLLGVKRIDHALLHRAWGFGYVWVERLTPKCAAYVAKYVSKDGEVPAFLYGERSRSVRIVRVSPGFWDRPSESREEAERRKADVLPWYRTVGQVLEAQEGKVVVRDVDTGRIASVASCCPYTFIGSLLDHGKAAGSDGRWLLLAVPFDVALVLGPQGSPPSGGEAGLHLNQSSDPHRGRGGGLTGLGRWLDPFLRWALGWESDLVSAALV
jgi:hypothetical protein